MAVSFLVSDLQDRVRFRCALPAFTTETNVTTADILLLVRESLRRLCGLMAEYSHDAQFASTVDLVTVPSVATIALPTNFTKLLQIHWLRSASEVVPLRMVNAEDMSPAYPTLDWTNKRPEYRIQGVNLEFVPTPRAVFTVRIHQATGLFPTSAGDTVLLDLGWDEWIVLDCCCKVRQRQEKAYDDFAGERALIQREIELHHRRDKIGTAQTRDVWFEDRYADPAGQWWRS